jgi:hypothetical protein
VSENALIGHTGFVGSTLRRQRDFDALFNSSNIEAIGGRQFRQIVCAGVSAVKWLANKEPEADWQRIERLMYCLEHVRAEHFVLISTIDVYRFPVGLTEADVPRADSLDPYGRHRLALETFIAKRFPSYTIVRLPALFGSGLKKNALFDLMTGNMTDRIVPNASFQWYPLCRLASDLATIVDAHIPLVNISAEPVTMAAIHERFFSEVTIANPVELPYRYDIRSMYDRLLGGHNGYHLDAASVLSEMETFLSGPTA